MQGRGTSRFELSAEYAFSTDCSNSLNSMLVYMLHAGYIVSDQKYIFWYNQGFNCLYKIGRVFDI